MIDSLNKQKEGGASTWEENQNSAATYMIWWGSGPCPHGGISP